jgi:hypothetical protein
MATHSGSGLALGAGLGILFDAIFGTIGLGLVFGAGIGVVMDGAAPPRDVKESP